MMKAVLGGLKGAVRDTVLLNAAAGLVAAERAGGFEEGLGLALQSMDSGAALGKLDSLVNLTRSMGQG
jgi:anthranilate phosphoribosyltransferase